jgi:plastocyanin
MRKLLVLLTAVTALGAMAVPGAGGASGARVRAAAKPKIVSVADKNDGNTNFYSPKTVKIRAGAAIKWVWKAGNANSHSVVEQHSRFASAEKPHGTFKHTFKKAGTFRIFCSVHPTEMTMKVVVKK